MPMALHLSCSKTAKHTFSTPSRAFCRPIPAPPTRLLMATAGSHETPAEVVVQKQLEAYNARDLEAFMDLLADDCVAVDQLSGAVLGANKQELRKRYEARFQTEVHSELLGRLCLGSVVVDREIITGLPDAGVADCLATYHCEGGKIKKMQFVWQPRKQ